MRIKSKRRKESFAVQNVNVNVVYQPNLDAAIARALLVKLGLDSDLLIDRFHLQFNHGNLITLFVVQMHGYGKWLATQISTARRQGSVNVTVGVDVLIVQAILTFLGQAAFDRVTDAGGQLDRAVAGTVNGIEKRNVEIMNDLNPGGGKIVHGALDLLTAPVGSNLYNRGKSELTDGARQFGKGAGKILVQNPADDLLMLGGGIISGLQTLTFAEAVGRALDAGELAVLTAVFGSSVEYGAIRIKTGYAGLTNIGDDSGFTLINNRRALTHGNTIYMKYETPGSANWNATLVHETTHVWQNQNGGTDYLSEALYAQIFGEGYEYADVILNGRTWFLLNPEQQGQLIEDAFINGYFQNGGWSNIKPIRDNSNNIIPPQNMINYMNQVKPQLQAGQGAT